MGLLGILIDVVGVIIGIMTTLYIFAVAGVYLMTL
jgi:hypothetical protein